MMMYWKADCGCELEIEVERRDWARVHLLACHEHNKDYAVPDYDLRPKEKELRQAP